MRITLLAALSADGFIADAHGNGNFSSPEDKAHLRAFLSGKECDCFICGRKTAEEFGDKLTAKPLFVLTRQRTGSFTCFSDVSDLSSLLKARGLSSPVLLGGAETYAAFLQAGLVDKMILTTEENVVFQNGKSFELPRFINDFDVGETRRLSPKTTVTSYLRKKPRG